MEVANRDPRLWRELAFARDDEAQIAGRKALQDLVDSGIGLKGEELLVYAREISIRCENRHCVLQYIDDGKEVLFTLRVGAKRKGREEFVSVVQLDQKTADGRRLSEFCAMEVVPIEILSDRDQEAVATRWRAKLLGKRVGGKNLTPEFQRMAGQARWKKLDDNERKELASRGGRAAAGNNE